MTGDFWLGGSDEILEGDWMWINGERTPRGVPYWALDTGLISRVTVVGGSYVKPPAALVHVGDLVIL